ncbi:unnamed protein product [marine sediment metagenome]|uniref:Uncharacterized protein n=1 Tax=marine sediment metagenome TaxID=412755 RepID=X1IQF4_9ZZZZ
MTVVLAKLTKLPEQAIIDGFKGTLDFYVHDTIPCVRKWPRSPGKRRAPAVEAQWLAFAYASATWNSLSDEVKQAYEETASEVFMTGRDLFTKSFLKDYFRDGQWG